MQEQIEFLLREQQEYKKRILARDEKIKKFEVNFLQLF